MSMIDQLDIAALAMNLGFNFGPEKGANPFAIDSSLDDEIGVTVPTCANVEFTLHKVLKCMEPIVALCCQKSTQTIKNDHKTTTF